MKQLFLLGRVFDRRQKWLFVSLLGFIVIVALILATGVGAVLPLVSMFVNPELLLDHEWGKWLYDFLGGGEFDAFTLKLLLAYGVLYAVIQLSLIGLAFFQNWFVQGLLFDFRTRILQGYIQKSYEFYLTRNSAILLTNTVNETGLFVTSLVMNILNALTNILILLIVFLALVAVDYLIAFSVAVVGGVLFLLANKMLKGRIDYWGKLRGELFSQINKTAHLVLTGANLIKVHDSSDAFVERFRFFQEEYRKTSIKYATVSSSLSHVAHLLVFGSGIMALLVSKAYGFDLIGAMPMLVFYAVGFSRIFPAAVTLFSNIMSIQFYWASYEKIGEALEAIGSGSCVNYEFAEGVVLPNLARSIGVRGVWYSYPFAEAPTLCGVDLEISRGEHVAFVGKSGSGKSTLINLLLGLTEPEKGTIDIDGNVIDRYSVKSWRDQIGYVPQENFLIDATLRENICFGIPPADVDEERLWRVVSQARLDGLVAKLPNKLDSIAGERGVKLSGGERQRVCIARALYRNPKVLIMDEPTSALDSITEREIIDDVLTSNKDITIIIVTHRLSSVRRCDKIYMFEEGRVAAQGRYGELLEASADFQSMSRVDGISGEGSPSEGSCSEK